MLCSVLAYDCVPEPLELLLTGRGLLLGLRLLTIQEIDGRMRFLNLSGSARRWASSSLNFCSMAVNRFNSSWGLGA